MRHNHIWISEIDLQEFRLVGEKKDIWGGSQVLAWCPEAPHLYKKDGWYYLLIAEGGTGAFPCGNHCKEQRGDGRIHRL